MKFFSRRLATLVAIASATCLVSMRSVLGQEAPDAVNPSSQDFESLNHGHKKNHYHHHHKGPHKYYHKKPHKHYHKRPHCHRPSKVHIVKEINLVCDGFIIDKIACPRKPVIMYSAEDQTPFDAQNNVPPPEQLYVVMSTPCSNDLPANCAAVRALAAQTAEESETILAKRADEFDDNNNGKHKKQHHYHHGKHHHGKLHHGKHHHCKLHHGKLHHGKLHHGKHHHGKLHHGKHHNDKHHHGKKHGHGHGHHGGKNTHPYQDRCVTVGDFCGSKLYGCNFDAKTQYRCHAIGEPPVVILPNAQVCGGNTSPESDCTCPGTGDDPVCGHDLPASCAAHLNTIYICRGGKGSKPEHLSECKPGTICIKKSSPEGASCGSGTCDCKGDNEVCSNQFPDECGLEKNTIYKCTNDGKPKKVETCDDSKTCVALSDGAGCAHKDCKCPENGTSCGEIFPLSCKIKTAALYTCQKGEPPVLLKDCSPDRCSASKAQLAAAAVFTSTANDHCVDKCTCDGWGQVCGSTFNPYCKLEPSTLYHCEGEGSIPKPGDVCGQGGCTVNNGNDKCNPDPCTCPGSGFDPVCGSELPSECYALPNVIYICRGGSGTKPEPLSQCNPGTTCIKKPSPEGASCGSGTCDCEGDNEVCSNQFPDKCGLEKNTIYKCTRSGKPKKVKTCKDTQACVVVSDGAACANTDCKCTEDGTSCGEIFPLTCELKTSALYTCYKGGDPVFLKNCYPDRCSASKSQFAATSVFSATANDKCTDKCTCSGTGPVCGSTFSPDCMLESSKLYKCDGEGSTPKRGEDCGQGGCTVNNGDDKCSKSKCTCPAPGTAPICGSDLPAECYADHTKIYQCPGGTGTEPKELSTCPPGTVCIKKASPEGASCGSDTCDCYGYEEVCSSAFKDECGLEKNAIYKCTREGEAKKVKNCDATESCVNLSDGPICTTDDCKCATDGIVCGQVFPLTCKIKTTALYTCVKGNTPSFKEDCDHKGCVATKPWMSGAAAVFEANAANDKCSTKDECDCHGKGAACGSTYPHKCAYKKDTIYKCDRATGTPTPGDKCAANDCVVHVGDDKCGEAASKCTCPSGFDSVCGFDLPEDCKREIEVQGGAIYYCPNGDGTLPEVQAICPAGLTCQSKKAPTGAACGGSSCDCKGRDERCSDVFPADCGLKENTIYKCSKYGVPEKVETCPNGKVCITIDDEAVCTPDDCKCRWDGDVCGEAFPLLCKLKATALYTCKDGGNPYFKSDCYPNRCSDSRKSLDAAAAAVFGMMKDDACSDSCLCSGEGPACGVSFPKHCDLKAGGLYKCDRKDAKPYLIHECKNDVCVINPGDNSCGECKCIDTDDICGNVFPSLCDFKTDTIYSCKGGAGSIPKFKEQCPSKKCTAKSGNDECTDDHCVCKDNRNICGKQFSPDCHFLKETLYKCSAAGADPHAGEGCAKGCSVIRDAPDQCTTDSLTSDDCKCKDGDAVCGSTFPVACHREPNSLYSCDGGRGSDPTKKEPCATGSCHTKDGPDECTKDSCACTGTDTKCSKDFDPACKLPEGVYKCAKGKPERVEDCTASDTCKQHTDGPKCTPEECICKDESKHCGVTMHDKCRLTANTLYSCTTGEVPKEEKDCNPGVCSSNNKPAGNATALATGSKFTATADGEDFCIDKCACVDSHKSCGSSFPTICNLVPTALYNCKAPGEKPTEPTNCTSACEYTQPDHSCKVDVNCSPQVADMSKQIDVIVEQMERLMQTDGSITQFAYPPFIKTLNDIKTSMTNDAQSPDKLSLEAGTVKKTIIAAGRIFVALQPLFPAQDAKASLPLIQDMRDLIPLIDNVIACTGGNQSDCSGIIKLWKDFNDQVVKYLTDLAATVGPPVDAVIKELIEQINGVTLSIDEVFKTRDDSTLPAVGKVLNGIIGKISGNGKVFQQAANPINMYFEAAKEALKCEGFNITVFADKCSAYGDRLQGGLADIIDWIKNALNNVPLIGPLVTTPILDAIKEAAITLQNAGGNGVGGIIGILVGIIQLFGLIKNEDNTGDSETKGILSFLGIADVAGDCGGSKAKCMGFIQIAKILIQALSTKILGMIPFGLGTVVSGAVNSIVDVVAKAFEAGSSLAINAALAPLKVAQTALNFVFGDTFKDILSTFVGGIESIAKCLATSEDADDKGTPPTELLISNSQTLTMF
ncbi:hypothetical protein BGZ96_004646 [Linnemannia gamsii]|uniref:Uncharacterized protein n=1 Tax=Linnemannia gamsii TaxID=64522 RepID=A0ABQ7K633_9FUNG|nr:hypothetical protein BGZ96_004646 [Linnemannia gamsii]